MRAALVVRREVELTWISKLCVLALGTIGTCSWREACAFLAIPTPSENVLVVEVGCRPRLSGGHEQFSRGTARSWRSADSGRTDPGDLREDSGQEADQIPVPMTGW